MQQSGSGHQPLSFQEPLRFDRGHAAGTGRGDGLAVMMVLHVAGGENAFDVRFRAVVRDQVAVFVHIQLAFEELRVGIVADGDENAGDVSSSLVAFVSVLRSRTFSTDLLVHVVNFFDDVRSEELNFFVGARAIQHDLRGAKFVAAMNERNLASRIS